jgi:hypothetical protein
VSRHHCALWVDDFSVRVRDLGSTNGTFVNNQRVRGELVLGAGDHIRVGKLDFELLVGDLDADKRGDSSQGLPGAVDAATSETTPLATTDTSFEIPVPSVPEDTGSSILAPESLTPVPAAPVPAGGQNGDTTVVWSPQAAPGYGAEMYPPMGMPYQPQYQPAYNPYMPPGMGYQPYPQMPMGYPGMYPQMGGYAAAPTYAPPQQQPAASPEAAPSDEAVSMPTVRLPDPKTTGAKAPPPPPPPAPAPEPEKTEESSEDPNNPSPFGEQKPAAAPNVKPAENAADILKKYTQRRPV